MSIVRRRPSPWVVVPAAAGALTRRLMQNTGRNVRGRGNPSARSISRARSVSFGGTMRRFSRRRFGGNREKITTDEKDFARSRFRRRSRRSARRVRALRKFGQIQKALDIPICLYTYSFQQKSWAPNGGYQSWDAFVLGKDSDLHQCNDRAYVQEVEKLVTGAADGQIAVAPQQRRTTPVYMKHLFYDVSIYCVNPGTAWHATSLLVDWQSGLGSGGVAVDSVEPLYVDVYEALIRRDIKSGEFDDIRKLFATGVVTVPYIPTVTSEYYGARVLPDSTESWASASEVTPFDYSAITRFCKIYNRSRYVLSLGS